MLRKLLAFVIVPVLLSAGCGEKPVTAVGSTALLPVARTAADEFMRIHPDITVNVSGGGSFTGLAQVASGYIDIGVSDVPAPADDPFYGDLVEHVVAIAPFAVIVHPGVQVDNLSHDQLVGVLTGEVTDWRDLGHPESLPVNLINRPPSSGSRMVVRDTVLGERRFSPKAAVMNTTGEMLQSVATIAGAVGYCDYAYLEKADVKPLAFEGYAVSADNVIRGDYPIVAYGRMYTKGEPKGYTRQFIDYVQSDAFQEGFVAEMGFVPVSALDAVRGSGYE